MNPWLEVPLADYEGHMRSPDVDQLGPLSRLFADALRRHRPESVAVLGVAGGNGLEHVDPAVTRRIVGLDINPGYLDAARGRFGSLPGLELHRVDLSGPMPAVAAVALVHAALVFEHAGLEACLDHALALRAPAGVLSVVLQLPSDTTAAVGPSGFTSIEALSSRFQLIDPAALERRLRRHGLHRRHQAQLPLVSGKALWAASFGEVEV